MFVDPKTFDTGHKVVLWFCDRTPHSLTPSVFDLRSNNDFLQNYAPNCKDSEHKQSTLYLPLDRAMIRSVWSSVHTVPTFGPCNDSLCLILSPHCTYLWSVQWFTVWSTVHTVPTFGPCNDSLCLILSPHCTYLWSVQWFALFDPQSTLYLPLVRAMIRSVWSSVHTVPTFGPCNDSLCLILSPHCTYLWSVQWFALFDPQSTLYQPLVRAMIRSVWSSVHTVPTFGPCNDSLCLILSTHCTYLWSVQWFALFDPQSTLYLPLVRAMIRSVWSSVHTVPTFGPCNDSLCLILSPHCTYLWSVQWFAVWSSVHAVPTFGPCNDSLCLILSPRCTYLWSVQWFALFDPQSTLYLPLVRAMIRCLILSLHCTYLWSVQWFALFDPQFTLYLHLVRAMIRSVWSSVHTVTTFGPCNDSLCLILSPHCTYLWSVQWFALFDPQFTLYVPLVRAMIRSVWSSVYTVPTFGPCNDSLCLILSPRCTYLWSVQWFALFDPQSTLYLPLVRAMIRSVWSPVHTVPTFGPCNDSLCLILSLHCTYLWSVQWFALFDPQSTLYLPLVRAMIRSVWSSVHTVPTFGPCNDSLCLILSPHSTYHWSVQWFALFDPQSTLYLPLVRAMIRSVWSSVHTVPTFGPCNDSLCLILSPPTLVRAMIRSVWSSVHTVPTFGPCNDSLCLILSPHCTYLWSVQWFALFDPQSTLYLPLVRAMIRSVWSSVHTVPTFGPCNDSLCLILSPHCTYLCSVQWFTVFDPQSTLYQPLVRAMIRSVWSSVHTVPTFGPCNDWLCLILSPHCTYLWSVQWFALFDPQYPLYLSLVRAMIRSVWSSVHTVPTFGPCYDSLCLILRPHCIYLWSVQWFALFDPQSTLYQPLVRAMIRSVWSSVHTVPTFGPCNDSLCLILSPHCTNIWSVQRFALFDPQSTLYLPLVRAMIRSVWSSVHTVPTFGPCNDSLCLILSPYCTYLWSVQWFALFDPQSTLYLPLDHAMIRSVWSSVHTVPTFGPCNDSLCLILSPHCTYLWSVQWFALFDPQSTLYLPLDRAMIRSVWSSVHTVPTFGPCNDSLCLILSPHCTYLWSVQWFALFDPQSTLYLPLVRAMIRSVWSSVHTVPTFGPCNDSLCLILSPHCTYLWSVQWFALFDPQFYLVSSSKYGYLDGLRFLRWRCSRELWDGRGDRSEQRR